MLLMQNLLWLGGGSSFFYFWQGSSIFFREFHFSEEVLCAAFLTQKKLDRMFIVAGGW